MRKTLKAKLSEARLEIEELAMQLADMIGATLHYAGVPDSKMAQAVEAYLNEMDKIYSKKNIDEVGYEDVIAVVESLKKQRKELFA